MTPLWEQLVSGVRLLYRQRKPKTLGERGELAAAKYLRQKGYRIVEHGARGPLGEIDLVAVKEQTIVFVEVKTRTSHDRGHPADAVHAEKQRRLTRLALAYLRSNDLLEVRAQFDVVAVTWSDHALPMIEHYPNAFEAVGQGQMFA